MGYPCPRRIKELGPKIRATVEKLTVELQRSPLFNEIAEYLDIDEEVVLESMEMGRSYQALSMDHTLEADSEGGTVTLFDLVGTTDDGYEATRSTNACCGCTRCFIGTRETNYSIYIY